MRLKNDGSSPTLTADNANKPTFPAFRDNVRLEYPKLTEYLKLIEIPKLTNTLKLIISH